MATDPPSALLADQGLRGRINSFLSSQPEHTSSFASLHAKFFKKHSFAMMKAYFKSQPNHYLVKSQSVTLTQGGGQEAQGPSPTSQDNNAASTHHDPQEGSQATAAASTSADGADLSDPNLAAALSGALGGLEGMGLPNMDMGSLMANVSAQLAAAAAEAASSGNMEQFAAILGLGPGQSGETAAALAASFGSANPGLPDSSTAAGTGAGTSSGMAAALQQQQQQQQGAKAGLGPSPGQKKHPRRGGHASTAAQGSADSLGRQLGKQLTLGDDQKDTNRAAAAAQGAQGAQAQEPSLASLPPDCLALIFSLCKSNRDMKSFCSCCKALRCEAVRSQIDRISLDCNAITHAVQGLACFASFAPGLQQLRLSLETEDAGHPVFGGRGPMKGAWQILKLFQACKESSPTGAAARQSLSRIKCLAIEECNLKAANRGNLRTLAEHLKTLCPQLKEVELFDVNCDDVCLTELIRPLQLQSLMLTPPENYSISPIGLAQLTTLTHLQLDLAQDEEGCLGNLGCLSRLTGLQRLELEGPVDDDLKGLDKILQHCTQLKHLHLYGLPKYKLPKPPSLERFEIESLTTDDFSNLVDAVQRNLSPVYVIESLTVHPASGGSMKEVKAAASKLARYKAVKWDECDTLFLDQAVDAPSDEESDIMDYQDEEEDWYSRGSYDDDDGDDADQAARHAAFKDALNALEPLGRVLQGTVTSLTTVGIRFKKKDMKQLARFAGPSVHHVEFEECELARSTLAEAVRALPALKRVSIDNLGLAKNHRAVLDGIDARVEKDEQQQRPPLHLELKPRDVWYHPSYDDDGCYTHMKMDKEKDHMEDIKCESEMEGTAGKVMVTIHDSYEDSLYETDDSDGSYDL